LFLLLLPKTIFSQTPTSGVFINWNVEVGCQTFSNEEIRDEKEPILIENISDSDCIKVCESSKVTYTLSGNLGTSPATQWSVIGGTITSQNATSCLITWGSVGAGSLSFTVTNACGCSSTYKRPIEIGERGFDIECLSVVCEGQTVTYNLPFDGQQICHDNFNWIVASSTLQGTFNIGFLQSGNYIVQGKNNNVMVSQQKLIIE